MWGVKKTGRIDSVDTQFVSRLISVDVKWISIGDLSRLILGDMVILNDGNVLYIQEEQEIRKESGDGALTGHCDQDGSLMQFHVEQMTQIVRLGRTYSIYSENEGATLPTYYFTFGSSKGFPYQETYLAVKAVDKQSAICIFRQRFPDRTKGMFNASECYNQVEWDMLAVRWYRFPPMMIIEERA